MNKESELDVKLEEKVGKKSKSKIIHLKRRESKTGRNNITL
jgi:hypothetical protein